MGRKKTSVTKSSAPQVQTQTEIALYSRPFPKAKTPPISDAPQSTTQMKSMVQLKGASAGGAASPELEQFIQRERGKGQTLSESLRNPMENAFGADFSGVRIHTDNTADQLNQSIQAKAFTTGQDVFFRQGAYAPESKGGQELLAHELTHVVQQNQATVSSQMIQAKPGDEVASLDSLANSRFVDMQTRNTGGYQQTNQQIITQFMAHARQEAMQLDDLQLQQAIIAVIDSDALDPTNIDTLLNTFQSEINQIGQNKARDFYYDCRDSFKRLKGMKSLKSENLGEYYLNERQQVAMPQAYLDRETERTFAAALKTMPIITYLRNPDQNQDMFVSEDTNDMDLEDGQKKESRWRNGGSILDNVNIIEKSTRALLFGLGTTPKSTLEENGINRNALEDRLRQAESFIKRVVEPDILRTLDSPTINVTTRKVIEASTTLQMGVKMIVGGYQRASEKAGEVTIGYNEKVKTIAHEIGHYIEESISSDLWHDIQLLMRSRHDEAGGGNRVGHNIFKGKMGGLPTESRYRGKYKGTGQYTSRYYGTSGEGGTEMTSLTLEFLSQPKKVYDLIEKDPLQSAIILRKLCPNEYQSINALRNFDDYLPH